MIPSCLALQGPALPHLESPLHWGNPWVTELLRLTFVVPTEAGILLGQPWVSVVPRAPVPRLLLGEGLVMSHPPQHCKWWKLLALVLWMANFPVSPGDTQATAGFFSQLPSLQSHSYLQPQKDSVRRGPGRLQAGVPSLWACLPRLSSPASSDLLESRWGVRASACAFVRGGEGHNWSP